MSRAERRTQEEAEVLAHLWLERIFESMRKIKELVRKNMEAKE